MSILHVSNIFFEWELAGKAPPTLEEALAQNPICEQLQFLPLVYADSKDAILVTAKPQNAVSHPLFLPEDRPPVGMISSWGYSLLIQEWADKRNIPYPMPPWDIVKMVNSKTYSFSKSPLPGSTLLYQGDPILPNMVLKSCYGTAGRGLIFSDSPKAPSFCQEQWKLGLPIIAEPKVQRDVDFSTQWAISNSGEIAFIGATICETTVNGAHIANSAGMPDPPYVEEQKAVAQEVLQEMADMGYFGEVGFDAMVYNGDQLQPIVEINARKTMGLITLIVQQKHHPEKKVRLAYISSNEPLPLPQKIRERSFSRQVIISVK